MDKGLTRYLRGRGRIALAVAVSLVLVLALPTLAFAVTWGAPFPTGTLHTTAQLVGVNAFSSTALDVRTASITIDGVSQAVAVNVAGASTGDWAITEIGPADDGSYRIRWTWTAAVADTTKVSLSCAPAGSAATTGTHNVVASIGGVSTPWTYVVARTTPAPIPPSSVTATTVAGCECHPGFQTSHHHGDAVCADCHTGVNAPAHGDPYGSFTHVILPTASMDTTNQACVASGCHSRDLVTAHNNASCWSSSCHASYDVGPGQPGCPCHGAAKGRPTGDLAHNMSAATLNNGATLQCTTCHNTPNHMGHTPVNYYGAGQRAGEPPLHRAITAATVDSQNQGCINCHGVGGSVDLALVHWNGKSKLSGCFCHDAANYTNNAVTSSGQTFKFVIDAGRNGSPVYCTDCHSWADVQTNHGNATTTPTHAMITPPSSNTTDTACVSSGCHTEDIVAIHNPATKCTAACHTSYGGAYDFTRFAPAACSCHGAAALNPTGDLANNMKNALIAGGSGLVCTTCHNTPGHMGHTPANYYGPGTGHGEPPLHAPINTTTVNASSAGCVQCHGNGDGTADLALVHWNKGEALGGCFCHANSAYAAEITAGVGGAHVSCTDAGCHDLPTVNEKHANQTSGVTHPIMPTASMDTTNQACVGAGCHDEGLVGVHNSASCWSASCHVSYGSGLAIPVPDACPCHGAAAGRPTGDLANNMLNGLNSATSAGGLGSTVECTTCHNTPNHMGHVPANYYYPGSRQGEPPLHLLPGTLSAACVACHGSDLPTVHSMNPSFGGNAPGCVCHTGFFVADVTAVGIGNTPDCVLCHKGQYAPHGFTGTDVSDTFAAVSGHNTQEAGTIGAKSAFDGSQNVTLNWVSSISSSTLVVPTSVAGATQVGVTTGQTGVVGTNWALPTQGVFWDPADPQVTGGHAEAHTWTDVITCESCHTGLTASGPHGAAQNWGLDTNYPAPYNYGELTKYITCNTAYVSATVAGQTLDDGFRHIVIFLNRADAVAKNAAGAYQVTDPAGASSPYFTALAPSGIAAFPGAAAVPPTPVVVPLLNIDRTDGTSGTTAIICAKCHKLETTFPDPITGALSIVAANTAHGSHHQDQTDGSAQCVGCHVGIPHAWKRPRLLVNTDKDAAPYLDAGMLGTTRTGYTGTMTGTAGSPIGANGFNRQGMQVLSALDQHTLGAAGTSAGGTTQWAESQCTACGDHNYSQTGTAYITISQ